MEGLSQEGIKEGCREQPGTKQVYLECNSPATASILVDVLAKLFCDSFVGWVGINLEMYPNFRKQTLPNKRLDSKKIIGKYWVLTSITIPSGKCVRTDYNLCCRVCVLTRDLA